jgi:FRG domain
VEAAFNASPAQGASIICGGQHSHNDEKYWLREEYKTLYRRFISDAWPLLKARERSDWGIAFSMQHYGIPTRLLDWTESFACALFFAQYERQPEDEAAIYVLDPQQLNILSIGAEGLIHLDEGGPGERLNVRPWHPKYRPPEQDLPTIAVIPIFTNPRMLAQRSGFTLSGDSFDRLEI